MKIDSHDIEWALMRERSHRSTLVPRFTATNWWECDVAELTPAGYWREYEIKTSKGDYYADRRKSRHVCVIPGDWSSYAKKSKHDLLAAGSTKGPSQFYFVTPEGLLKVEHVPVWAGLIYVYRRGGFDWPEEQVIKKAPFLHREKAGDKMRAQIHHCCHGRAHHMWSQQYFRYLAKRKKKLEKNEHQRSKV